MNDSQNLHYFEKGFFSFLGNSLEFKGISEKVFYLLFALSFVAFVLVWLFRYEISKRYRNLIETNKWFKNDKKIFQFIGALVLFLAFIRIVILVSQDFYNTWEMIPLHLCRLNLFLIGFIFVSGKIENIKHITFTSIVGALIGFSIPSLGYFVVGYWNPDHTKFISDFHNGKLTHFTIGMDNYIYWEFLLTHLFVFLTPFIVVVIKEYKFSSRNFIQAWALLMFLIILTFVINSITDTYIHNPRWKTNYFFNGRPPINEFNDKLYPFTSWPFSLLSQIVIGSLFFALVFFIYCYQDKFFLTIENKKIKFNRRKSQNWEQLKIVKLTK